MTVSTSNTDYVAMRGLDVHDIRNIIRSGAYQGHTAGLAAGRLQANVVILPESQAVDFMRFCQRNAKSCPLVGVSDTASPMMHTLGRDIDIRTDIPSYTIYRDGEPAGAASDISDLWRDDMVAFALGCSFTFDCALMADGISLQHIERNITVPMYRTMLPAVAAGPFGGGLVVSMRPIRRADVDRAVEISGHYPQAHGSPIHIGDPGEIGIDDLDSPDWGEPCTFSSDEIPVFWGCGVTPQNAVLRARPALCITHTPGCMLITDVDEHQQVPVIDPATRTG
jgi:uncharacterized protein YcsI (UPF0317 family)